MPDEKFDEKEMEKREEKAPDEKWRRDPLGAVIWALILIWIGVVLLLENTDTIQPVLDNLAQSTNLKELRQVETWNVILFGMSIILFAEIIIRLIVPAYRRSVVGTFIFAMILLGVSMGNIINWTIIWATILIVGGVSLLLRGFFSKR